MKERKGEAAGPEKPGARTDERTRTDGCGPGGSREARPDDFFPSILDREIPAAATLD